MRKLFAPIAAMLLLATSLAWGAPNPAEYTVNVHVVSSRLETQFLSGKSPNQTTQELDVAIDGKKYELAGSPVRISLLARGFIVPGEYKAKLVKESHKGTYASTAEYELLFPDGATKKFEVVGETE